jgi:hypothetical protein
LQNHKTGFQRIWLAIVLSRGDALPPGQSRCVRRRHAPGHAAACCCASLGRPHPHHALRRVDKAPGGQGISFLLFEPHRRQPPFDAEIHLACFPSNPPEHSNSFAKFLAIDCAPERKLYPTVAPTRAVFLSHSGRSAAASTSPWPASLRASPLPLLALLKSW